MLFKRKSRVLKDMKNYWRNEAISSQHSEIEWKEKYFELLEQHEELKNKCDTAYELNKTYDRLLKEYEEKGKGHQDDPRSL